MKKESDKPSWILEDRHIVFVLGWLALGGSERQALLLARGLKDMYRAKVTVVGFSGPGHINEECRAAGIPCHLFRIRSYVSGFKQFISWVKLVLFLRRLKPDGLLAYCRDPNLYCGLGWKLTGARLCIWNQRDAGIGLGGRWTERVALRRSSFVLSNSEHGLQALKSILRMSRLDGAVIPNGIRKPSPLRDRPVWRKELDIAEGAPVACMVANYHSNKHHQRAIEVWARLLKSEDIVKSGNPPVFIMAGKDYGNLDTLKNNVQSLGIPSRSIRFLEFVDDVAGLYGACDVCVYFSESEGCPNAVLEAMSMGLPVVGSDIPGIRDAVGPDGADLLAPLENEEALTRHLERMLLEGNERNRKGHNMMERIEREFDPDRLVRKSAAVLSGLVSSRRH